MEAIEPGSSTKSQVSNSYERFPHVTEGEEIEEYDTIHTSPNEAYSILSYQKQQRPQSPPAAIYDEPNTIPRTRMPKPPSQPSGQTPHSPSGIEAATYEEPLTITVPPLTQKETSGSSTNLEESTKLENSEEDHYTYVKDSGSMDSGTCTYEKVRSPPRPRKSETVPKNLESFSEISLEDLSNLNSNEVQLWTLLQMQKMVRKMENIYDTTEAVRPPTSRSKQEKSEQPQKLNLPPPHPPPFPPPQEIEELYDEDIGDEAFDEQPARQDLYINLDNLSETLTEGTPPPVPPRTYSCKGPSSIRKEVSVRNRAQSQKSRSHTPNQNGTKQKPQQLSHGERYPPLSPSKPNLAMAESQKSPSHILSDSPKRLGPPPPTKPKPCLPGKHTCKL